MGVMKIAMIHIQHLKCRDNQAVSGLEYPILVKQVWFADWVLSRIGMGRYRKMPHPELKPPSWQSFGNLSVSRLWKKTSANRATCCGWPAPWVVFLELSWF
jgi:hypothetical protein